MKKMFINFGGMGLVLKDSFGPSWETIIVGFGYPYQVYGGNSVCGTTGYAAINSQWFDIPADVAAKLPGSLYGYRCKVEITGGVTFGSFANLDFSILTPNSDGSFDDKEGIRFNKDVKWDGLKLASVKADFTLINNRAAEIVKEKLNNNDPVMRSLERGAHSIKQSGR